MSTNKPPASDLEQTALREYEPSSSITTQPKHYTIPGVTTGQDPAPTCKRVRLKHSNKIIPGSSFY